MNPTQAPTERPSQIRRPGVTPPSRRGGSGRSLDEVIVELGFVARAEMEGAVVAAARAGSSPDRVLLQEGKLTEEQVSRAVAERFGLDHIDLGMYRFDPNAAKLVTPAAVKRYKALPDLLRQRPHPAGRDGRPGQRARRRRHRRDDGLRGPARRRGRQRHRPRPRPPRRDGGGRRHRRGDGSRRRGAAPAATTVSRPATGPLYDLSELQGTGAGGEADASVIGLVHRVISEAVDRGASDIHWEPFEEEMKIRYRVDGVLIEAARIPAKIVPTIVSRIKILSELDIAERRIPQDGRVAMELEKRSRIDLRVVTLPCQYGESVIMRILDSSNAQIELDMLGMLPQARDRFTHAFSQAHGAVLVTGPDRLRQVDLALRRAQPGQHAREEHHHDRGPGRVPDVRHQAGAGQQQVRV